MSYPLADAARLLGTDRLAVSVQNAWVEATPEASIFRAPAMVDIEAAEEAV